jgi:hypothetical protein
MSSPPFVDRGPYTQAYARLRHFIALICGDMLWIPKPPGGEWRITLHGRSRTFPCHNDAVNPLDSLYVSDPANPPQRWRDFAEGERTPLVEDVFWRLVELMREGTFERAGSPPEDYPQFLSVSWVKDPPPGCEMKSDPSPGPDA